MSCSSERSESAADLVSCSVRNPEATSSFLSHGDPFCGCPGKKSPILFGPYYLESILLGAHGIKMGLYPYF